MVKVDVKTEFEIFVRTNQFMQQRIREREITDPVSISNKDLELFFNSVGIGKDKINDATQQIISYGTIERVKKDYYYTYKVLTPGAVKLEYAYVKGKDLDNTTKTMLEYLKRVNIIGDTSQHFKAYVNNKELSRRFFTVDNFSGRVHTPVTNLHSHLRDNLTIDNKPVVRLDLATAQPLILAKVLNKAIGENDFSNWIFAGKDIYIILLEKLQLETRDQAKKLMFKILFGYPDNKLAEIFGNANWINWINWIKTEPLKSNPSSEKKPHNNLCWILQTIEVGIFTTIWKKLINNNIPFLSVHDEVIVKQSDYTTTYKIFDDVMKGEFSYYKINVSNEPTPEPETPTEPDAVFHNVEKQPFIFIEKKQKSNWNNEIIELEQFFNTVKLPDVIRLSKWENITNCREFVNSHLGMAKACNGNSTFKPYLERLIKLKQLFN